MSTVVLLDDSRLPIGFLLLAKGGPVESAVASDCIFMVLPTGSPSLASQFLSERKHQEFSVAVAAALGVTRIEGQCRHNETLLIELPQQGLGRWSIATADGISLAGQCEWASDPK